MKYSCSVSRHPEDIYYDDWYAEVSETVTLSSTDGGLTWTETSNERIVVQPTDPSGDIMVDVSARSALTDEEAQERKQRLEEAGLGHLLRYNPRQWAIWLANIP